jgi:hypothetical protein
MKWTMKFMSITTGIIFLCTVFLPVCLADDDDGQPDMPPPGHGGHWEQVVTQWQDIYKTRIIYWNGAGWYTEWVVTRIPIKWHWMWVQDHDDYQDGMETPY